MFGFGKKKIEVNRAQTIFEASILHYQTIESEADNLRLELLDYCLIDKSIAMKLWVLLKAQILFSALAKNNDILIYDQLRDGLIKYVEKIYSVEFRENEEFSHFSRYKTSFAKHSEVGDLIASLLIDFGLNLKDDDFSNNLVSTFEVGNILKNKIIYHLSETKKAVKSLNIIN